MVAIAVGDGAEPGSILRPPEPGDTGLQNEVLRKEPLTFTDSDGFRTHQMTINTSEIPGTTINEIGIFYGSTPLLMGSFDGKLKDNVTRFIFNVKEN